MATVRSGGGGGRWKKRRTPRIVFRPAESRYSNRGLLSALVLITIFLPLRFLRHLHLPTSTVAVAAVVSLPFSPAAPFFTVGIKDIGFLPGYHESREDRSKTLNFMVENVVEG